MTEGFYEPGSDLEDDGLLDPADSLDRGDLAADEGYDAPDGYRGEGYGTTRSEEEAGESFDQLLAEQEPDVDPYAEAARRESGETLTSDVADTSRQHEGSVDLTDDSDGAPVPTLVEGDEGAHPDTTAELVAHEAGSRPGSAAEEQAVRLDTEE